MAEQATGRPGASDETPVGQRTVLVVDLDGEPLAPLRALEEILLCLGTWEDDDRQGPGTDTEPLRVSAPLAGRVALAAAQRLLTALAPTQSRGPGCGRLLAPDGRYEHAPLTALTLPAADINVLSATADALGHPRLNANIAELVDDHAEQLGGGYRRTDRTDLVSLLARLAGLLDLAPSDDTRLLTARLRATPPGTDCVLTDAEEAAHARTADRMNHMWAHGSGIDRYLY
ncbi:LuxR family transcriptional regulator [Blastococcus mobilis]|uniref:LuxR family transcriptional regulator n=1 Tax=Blastococcus mobilis TaxID=1938746 RepID=UPI000B77EB8E|nr:LuxR family transcriptional regulator [Blastococcus mobilis]